MAQSSKWGVAPRESIEAECARRGRDAVADGCIGLLGGKPPERELLLALGGPAADKFFDGAEHEDTYWFRVWALRGLLWSWDDRALDLVREALGDGGRCCQTDADAFAVWNGWRKGRMIEPVASAIAEVCAAIQPSHTHGSKTWPRSKSSSSS